MRICAVIVTYNPGNSIFACVSSIKDQVEEIVIIDNGFTVNGPDPIDDIVKKNGIMVIRNRENLGIATALNIGIRYALDRGYDWVLTLDQDSIASGDMVKLMTSSLDEFLKSNRGVKIGIIAPTPYDINAGKFLSRGEASDRGIAYLKVARTTGSLICGDVFKSTGFYNEKLFLYYVDDEFCLRAGKCGYKILLARQAVIFHEEGKKEFHNILFWKVMYDNYSPEAIYYIFRNGIYMFRNSLGLGPVYIVFIPFRLFRDTWFILLFSKNKANDLKHAVKGFAHGLAGQFGRLVSVKQ